MIKMFKQYIYLAAFAASILLIASNVQADPTGDCTTGQYCEQSSLATTNTTTTTNTCKS